MKRHKLTTVMVLCVLLAGLSASCGAAGAQPAQGSSTELAMSATQVHVDPVGGDDTNDGSREKPLATVGKALALAAEGKADRILVAAGNYGTLTIDAKFPRMVEVDTGTMLGFGVAAPGAPPPKPLPMHEKWPVFEKIAVNGAENITLKNLGFFIPDARTDKHCYVSVSRSKNVVLKWLQIIGEENDDWAAKKSIGIGVGDSEDVTIEGGSIHHVQFGITVSRVKNIRVANVDVGPFREDGIRFKNCEGVVCDGCHIHDAHKTKAEHCDGIQMIYWSHNVLLRNNHIHHVNQGIGAFASEDQKRRNWRIEGNLIYDIYNPNTLSVFDAVDPVIVNNTLP